MPNIDFCITTNGKRSLITSYVLAAIRYNYPLAHIYVCGRAPKFLMSMSENIHLIDNIDVDKGMLASGRNIAAEQGLSEIIVFLDDDIILDRDWAVKFDNFVMSNPDFQIYGNRIVLLDNKRFWDISSLRPQRFISYDKVKSISSDFYLTGGFWVIKRDIWKLEKWNSKLPYYATHRGFKENEDVEYSKRLIKTGHKIDFDINNKVWHCTNSYISCDSVVVKRQNNNICSEFKLYCELLRCNNLNLPEFSI